MIATRPYLHRQRVQLHAPGQELGGCKGYVRLNGARRIHHTLRSDVRVARQPLIVKLTTLEVSYFNLQRYLKHLCLPTAAPPEWMF